MYICKKNFSTIWLSNTHENQKPKRRQVTALCAFQKQKEGIDLTLLLCLLQVHTLLYHHPYNMKSKVKQIVQRNLPLNRSYELIDSHYGGEGEYTICQNCNKPISNVATVKDDKGKYFDVGLDCASTLTGLKDNPFLLDQHEYYFTRANSLKAKIRKRLKEGFYVSVTHFISHEGESKYMVDFVSKRGRGYGWDSLDADLFEKYLLPMVSGMIKNKEIQLDKYTYSKLAQTIAENRASRLSQL